MTRRSLTARLLSPLALSNTALVWSVFIGALGVLAFVPAQGATLRDWGVLLPIALTAEVVFVLVVLAVRTGGHAPAPGRVALALIVAGAARGVAIAVGTHVAGLDTLGGAGVIGRATNSAVFSLLGGALIGATLAWREDFHQQYRVLVDRALLLERADRDGEVDDEVLSAWTSIKAGLDDTLRRAGAVLAGEATAPALDEAASLLTSAIDRQLRPASRAMWDGALPDRPPISMRTLCRTALQSWTLPLAAILGFFGVLIGIGSVVRVGLVPGLMFTLQFLAVIGAVLGISVLCARRWPTRTLTIAICTLVLLPVLILAGIVLFADPVLGIEPDRLSEAVIAIQAPITTVLIAMAVEAVRHRARILDALQARVNATALGLVPRAAGAHDDARRLSVFMHHSVQSELAAAAMQLREAALTHEPAVMRDVSTAVLVRLGVLENLNAAAPPWLDQAVGDERIEEVVTAWTGILDVQVSLPEAVACRGHQWRVATQVIEEGLANAARHGDASRVVIVGRLDDTCLTLSIRDDGARGADGDTAEAAGMGMRWLDRVAPGDWALQHSPQGSTLVVTIR